MRKYPTLSIVLLYLFVHPIWSVDQITWNQAEALLKKKDYKSAFKLSESIIVKSPEDTFGWWLRMQSASQLANDKGKWPQECVVSAFKLATLEPKEEASHYTSAIWCLKQESRYQEIVDLIPKTIPIVRKKIGDNNYGLLINTLTFAYIKLGDFRNARSILKTGLTELSGTSSALHTGYNIGEIFQDESISKDEREEWHRLFSENLFMETANNPLLPSIIWNTSLLTDLYVSKRKYQDAFDTISLLYPEMDTKVLNHWGFLRDQLYIRYLALKFKTKRLKETPKRNLKMVFLVIPRTRLKGDLPTKLSKYQSLDLDLREKDLSDLLLSFEYFRDSFEDLSNGIHWDFDVVRTDAEIQKTNFIEDKPRFIMQPDISSIVPKLSDDLLANLREADGIVVVWPGTKQPDGILITNGGGTEWNYGTDLDPQVRLTILSDSNKNKADGNHANHPIFLYHEMFHVLEWAYHKLKFPKLNHPYQRKKEWPSDYTGNTEWDFYSETFQKRMLKEDNFDRVFWFGRKEGFYGISEKEKSK
jgi:tetratricopeptide (TPR) repeat protein